MKNKENSLINIRHLISELYWLGMANSIVMRELKGIEKDLEVLEIIKKCRFIGYQKFAGNTLIIDNITDEQYQEIKEWIEENEK